MIKQLFLAAGLIAAASGASAATSFNLTVSGSTNVPTFTLSNTSTSALLETFSISIGLVARNFDFINNVTDPAGGTSTVTIGDGVDGGTRFDVLALSFVGFDPSESMSFGADIDQDNANTVRDYRFTLFNNGTGPNSELTATFSDGTSLSFFMPDQTPGLSSYSFDVNAAAPAIPLPAGLPLFAAGLGALAVMRKRKT